MKKINRMISIIVTILLVMQLFIPEVYANVIKDSFNRNAFYDNSMQLVEFEDFQNDTHGEADFVGEIIALRDENTKHYRNIDGTYTAVMYADPVHYQKSGIWTDIDNELVAKTEKIDGKDITIFETKSSATPVIIPQSFSNGQKITIANHGYTLGFGVNKGNIKTHIDSEVLINDTLHSDSSKQLSKSASLIDGLKTTDSTEKNEYSLDNTTSAATYKAIFGSSDLEYIISPNKIKENILVNEPQASYVYKFDFDLDGLTPYKQDDGSIWLCNSDNDTTPIFILEAPYMYDANDEISYNVEMTFEENGDEYILAVVADESWLNDESRSFPVVIDPTVVMNTAGNVKDAYVSNLGSNFNYGTSEQLNTGKDIISRSRTYIKFNLPELPEESIITSIHMALYRNSGSLRDFHLNVYDLNGVKSWSETQITWNNQPVGTAANAGSSLPREIQVLTPSGSGYWLSFNISNAGKRWYEQPNTNNGLLIASSNETVVNDVYFRSSEYATASLRPQLQINYAPDPAVEFVRMYSSDTTFKTDTLTSHTYEAGRAGKAKIDDFSLNFSASFDDIGIDGNLMPVSISHHNNSTAYTFMKDVLRVDLNSFGNGWLLNYTQFLKGVQFSNNKVFWLFFDETGAMHIFEKDNEYYDVLGIENGLATLFWTNVFRT